MALSEVILDTYNPGKVVKQLSNYFNSRLLDNYTEQRINIPKTHGEGFIGGLDFRDGLGVMMFHCHLKKDLVLRYSVTEGQPLRMIFCMENDFTHVIKGDRMHYQLNNLLGSIVCGTCQNEQVFIIPAEKKVFYYTIEIDRKKYISKITKSLNSLPPELKNIFLDIDGIQAFLYQGNYSLTIAECIQKIHHNDHTGLVRRVFIESKTLEILAMQIKQYLDDHEPSKKQIILRKKDLELITSAKQILIDNLESPPTIKELSRRTGTNENKLKRGFKKLYNSTIHHLLRDERLNKAMLLIAEEKYSMKEIARKIGYKHAGHFTSQFKLKFGVLPKDYLKSLKEE